MINKNFVVGLFVSSAIIIFVFTSIWLTGKRGTEAIARYSMMFEKDVGGLMLGGPVFYLGVEVGAVTAMTIIPGNPMQVRVDTEVLKSTPVDKGTYASLALQGITGIAVIKLAADPGVHGPLQREKNQLYPLIKVRDTGFSALLAKAPNIVDKMDAVLEQVNQLLGEENRAFIRDTLSDISTVSSALASQEKAIAAIPVMMNKAFTELHETLIQIRSIAVDLEPELAATLDNIEIATESLAKLSARVENWTSDNDSDMHAFMRDGLGEVPALIADARGTLREIEKLVRDLREDPSVLIYKPVEEPINVED